MAYRFWIISATGHPVRLRLTADQPLTLHGGGPTDEGYRYWESEYRIEGDRLVGEHSYTSRDCDGRYSGYSTAVARLDRLDVRQRLRGYVAPGHRLSRLEAIEEHARTVPLPDWHLIDGENRDYTAEAAGY